MKSTKHIFFQYELEIIIYILIFIALICYCISITACKNISHIRIWSLFVIKIFCVFNKQNSLKWRSLVIWIALPFWYSRSNMSEIKNLKRISSLFKCETKTHSANSYFFALSRDLQHDYIVDVSSIRFKISFIFILLYESFNTPPW